VTAVADLLDVEPARTIVASGFESAVGPADAERWTAQLGATAGDEAGIASDDADDADAGERLADEVAPLADLSTDDQTAIGRCLTRVLDTERRAPGPAIPAYVELLTVADDPAIAFVLVAGDDDGRFTVPEAWVVARDDCGVLATTER
jgi:hypothetical protein